MTDRDTRVSVRFKSPVEGIDPFDGEVFLSTRHRVAAVYVRQDRSETLFINDEGEVVARWATRLIEHIEWPEEASDSATSPSVGTLEWRREVQHRHPRAYQRWTDEEDADLTEQFGNGQTVEEMAELHQRRRGGITARLVRLGLIEPDTPEHEIGNAPQPAEPLDPAEPTTTPAATAAPVPPPAARRRRDERGRVPSRPPDWDLFDLQVRRPTIRVHNCRRRPVPFPP